jgi:glycosyltransferase involved in cell wall biosynthesis
MLSVLLATRNRASLLRRTLEALARLAQPAGGWHLVAVDNGSSEATPSVLAAYRQRLPLTCIREPQPGKSVALNAAIPALTGDLVVLLDDDIVPEPDWLLQHAAVAAAQPGFGVFGGRIEPLWEAEPPRWILDWVDLPLCYAAHKDLPEGACPFYLVYGGNMAVRAELFHRGLRFAPGYGPNGRSNYPLGEETEFVRRAELAGFRSWHCRSAVVRHVVPKAHLRESWVLARARNFGRNQYLMDGPAIRELRGGTEAETAARLRRAIAEYRWRAWRAAFSGMAEARFRARWKTSFLAGLALEHRLAMQRPGRAVR